MADAAGHGGAVDCYHGQAVAGSGGDCHLGDRVVHAGRVRDDRAGKHRAQRARTDHQAAKVGVAGEGCGTCNGNGVGLDRRRVLGGDHYRDGVGSPTFRPLTAWPMLLVTVVPLTAIMAKPSLAVGVTVTSVTELSTLAAYVMTELENTGLSVPGLIIRPPRLASLERGAARVSPGRVTRVGLGRRYQSPGR